jgi:YHS domain-containing protein
MQMKKLTLLILAVALFASMGCGNRPEEKDTPSTRTEKAAVVSLVDPVDGQVVPDADDATFSYVYKDTKYLFNSKKNYEAFKKDPEKYLNK